MSDLYRDFIDQKADQIINSLGGTITPPPANAELYRDFLDRKFDDVINAIGNVKIKSFTYTGDGNNPRTIQFPTKPLLFAVFMTTFANNCIYSDFVPTDMKFMAINQTSTGTSFVRLLVQVSFNNSTNELTYSGGHNGYLNNNNKKYTVYYI